MRFAQTEWISRGRKPSMRLMSNDFKPYRNLASAVILAAMEEL